MYIPVQMTPASFWWEQSESTLFHDSPGQSVIEVSFPLHCIFSSHIVKESSVGFKEPCCQMHCIALKHHTIIAFITVKGIGIK